METKDTTWYLGPAGEMVALPGLERATRNRELVQYISQGATGGRTVNTTGAKRTWELEVEGLTRFKQGLLQSFHSGMIAGPLYLLDPLIVNHLSPRASSGLSSWGPTKMLLVSGAGVTVNPVATGTDFPISPRQRFVAQLDNTSGSPGSLIFDGWKPLVPGNEYTFSVYLKTTASTTITIKSKTFAAVESTVTTSTQTVSAVWVRKSVTFTVPVGSVGIQVSISVEDDETVTIGPAQLERQGLSDWTPGEGTPVVEIVSMPETLPYWYYTDSTITLVEL